MTPQQQKAVCEAVEHNLGSEEVGVANAFSTAGVGFDDPDYEELSDEIWGILNRARNDARRLASKRLGDDFVEEEQ